MVLEVGERFAADVDRDQLERPARERVGRRAGIVVGDRLAGLAPDVQRGAGDRVAVPTRLQSRRRPESNRCRRLCRPLRSHSATSPRPRRVAARGALAPGRQLSDSAGRRGCPTDLGPRLSPRRRSQATDRRRRGDPSTRSSSARSGRTTSIGAQAHRAGRGRARTGAVPGVEAEVMVVAAGRDEQRARIAARGDVEAQHSVIEGLGVGDARPPAGGRGPSWCPAAPLRLGPVGGRELVGEVAQVQRHRRHLELAVGVAPLRRAGGRGRARCRCRPGRTDTAPR